MSTNQIPINTKQTKQAKQAKQAVLEDKIETIAPDIVQVQLEQSSKKEKKTVKQEVIELVNESEGEVVDSALEHEETYESYDDVFKAINDIDREMTKMNRKRIQLSKILNKFHTKETKQLKKKTKTPGDNSNRKKSGFNKPTRVPTAFCNYLSLDPDIELPRTNVTALLYRHIKELGMNSKEDGRVINPDEPLRQLLMMAPTENLKFENFQHFVARVYKAENSEASERLINVKTDNVEESEEEEEDDEAEEAEEELEE